MPPITPAEVRTRLGIRGGVQAGANVQTFRRMMRLDRDDQTPRRRRLRLGGAWTRRTMTLIQDGSSP